MTTIISGIIGVMVFCMFAYLFKKTEPATVTISDTLRPHSAKTRSKNQRMQDAVLQLQNEIIASGALKITDLENGKQKVELTVVI